MNFTVHSHCSDIAKHCAQLHIIVEHFPFRSVTMGWQNDGGGTTIVAVYCNVCDIHLQNRQDHVL